MRSKALQVPALTCVLKSDFTEYVFLCLKKRNLLQQINNLIGGGGAVIINILKKGQIINNKHCFNCNCAFLGFPSKLFIQILPKNVKLFTCWFLILFTQS